MATWTVVSSPWFVEQLQQQKGDLIRRKRLLEAASWPQPATDEFLPEAEAFRDFRSALQAVSPPDPLSKLEFFCSDGTGQRYYRLLEDGDWQAYYTVEGSAVVALTILNRTHSRKKILGALEIAIQEYRREDV